MVTIRPTRSLFHTTLFSAPAGLSAQLPLVQSTDGIEKVFRSNEYLPVGDSGRTERVVVEVVFGDEFERRTDLCDDGDAVLVGDVHSAVGQHR